VFDDGVEDEVVTRVLLLVALVFPALLL